jgi:enhancer of mRNA-decapping protein 4
MTTTTQTRNSLSVKLLNKTTMTEQFGATPLPQASVESPLKVWYDPSAVPGHPQQPHAQQVAAFEAVPNDDCINGSVLDVNQHFVVYAVKNGLIRVLHRSSTLRTLLRGHSEKVADMAFFQNSDVLGSVGGNVIIWRIFHRSPEIMAEKLLEIPSTLENISRLIWHPFNPNQFWLLQEKVATLVETTRITTVPHQDENHAICQWHSPNLIMDGAVQLDASEKMTDLCWSGKDTKHVLTTHQDGKIALWDVKIMGSSSCIQSLQEDEPVTRCMFLPHDNLVGVTEDSLTSSFLTASRGNSLISLWSAWGAAALPTKLQTFGMEHPSTFNLDLCFGQASPQGEPPAFFILLSDRKDGKVFCVSLKSIWSTEPPKRVLADYFDYVVPFSTKYPIYSWSMACVPAEHVSEGEVLGGLNFDIKFHAYQSKMVQQYTLPHYMCFPPSNPYVNGIPGIRVEKVEGETADPTYDEDYELDEEYESENEDYEAPAAESLPIPEGLEESSDNPFANWLGAIATRTGMGGPQKGSIPPPPTPATSMALPSTMPPNLMASMESGPTLLHPAQLLSGSIR